MKLIQPPAMDAAELFLKLLEWPRPVIEVDHRISVEPTLKLHVRAVHSERWQRLIRAPQAERNSRVIVECICDADGKPVFESTADVALLSAEDHGELARAAIAGLRVCSPWFGAIDDQRWRAVLADGGRQLWPIVSHLADCGSVVLGYGSAWFNEEPERYWGCSRRELLDGHMMVYSVARHLVENG